MARDDNDQRPPGAARSRYWRAGEQRAIVGGCLQAAFLAERAAEDDADLLALLDALEATPVLPRGA